MNIYETSEGKFIRYEDYMKLRDALYALEHKLSYGLIPEEYALPELQDILDAN